MMDFNCKISSDNLKKIKKFLKRIGQKGIVLISGKSYHYYGIKLLSEKDYFIFLGKCLLFSGYADSRFIGHRLIDSYTSLRISKDIKHPKVPKVVAIL